MEQLITIIILLFIINVLAAFRFALFSRMNRKMVIFSLIMMNVAFGVIYVIQRIGLKHFNKPILIAICIIIPAIMLVVYYRNHENK